MTELDTRVMFVSMVVVYVISFELAFFLACATHTRKPRRPKKRTMQSIHHHKATKQKGKWLLHARRCGAARHRQARQAAHRLSRLRRRQWQLTCKAIITKRMIRSSHTKWFGKPAEAHGSFPFTTPTLQQHYTTPWLGGRQGCSRSNGHPTQATTHTARRDANQIRGSKGSQ